MDEKTPVGTDPESRRRYQKPQITEVKLRPEEAVLGNCKVSGSSGPATSNCGTFVCSSVGS